MKKSISLTILFLLVISTITVSGINRNNEEDSVIETLIKVDISNGIPELPRGIEIFGGEPGEYLNVILPENMLYLLDLKNIEYSIEIYDVQSYSRNFAGQYHTFAEIEQIMQDTANDFPEITSLFSIGTTYEGRDILCLEISDNPGVDEEEPGIFFMGLHHAREWPTVEICLYIINQLTSLYDSDPTITGIVDNGRIWVVPCVNPDGYYYCHDLGNDWRKNRHYFPEFQTYGVDLNRNYDGSVNGDPIGMWGSIGESSVTHQPDDETYCGPDPTSELETQAIKNFFIEHDICASITWHTHGELLLWPWGYSGDVQTPDDTYISEVGQEIASRITRQSGFGTYTPIQSAELYPTTGDTVDWAYGYYHYVLGKPLFAYTIEACEYFHPTEGALDQIVQENFDGALYLLQEAQNINNIVPRVIPPKISEIANDPDGNYIVSWQQQNPVANPEYYRLDELSGLEIVTDDAESGSSLWNLQGFSLTTSKSYSGTHSYKSRQAFNDVSSMTSVRPVYVEDETILTFWCWYDIEFFWDFAMVEISTDGRNYDVLDTYTGLSSGWQFKEYDLSDYVGKSVFIRFRHTTDGYITNDGLFVDDIYPMFDFGTNTTLSESIQDDFYEITGKENGTYFYQVKGYNSERGWGDFSTIERAIVGDGGDSQPPNLQIINPKKNYIYIKNTAVFPFFTTVILGEVTVEASATDTSGVDRVEFYIDDELVETDTNYPYNWTWSEKVYFKHTIKVIAYDNFDNYAEEEQVIWKFF